MRFFLFIKNIIKRICFSKILFIAFILLTALFLIFSPQFIFNKNNFLTNLSLILTDNDQPKSVLTLWHVETFEGGSANRAKYLEKIAFNFNKQNKKRFIVIKTINENQLYLNISQNNFADIYSFGVGSGYLLSSVLADLDINNNIRKDILSFCYMQEDLLAYPYLLSSYVLISKNDNFNVNKNKNFYELVVGLKGFINPARALFFDDYKFLKEKCNLDITSYEAYCEFVEGRGNNLIGTMRDYARVKNRERLGSISNCKYKLLSGYTDLIQCIGINKTLSTEKLKMAKDFCNFITQQQSQNLIRDYGLFSVGYNKIYDKDEMSNFENQLLKSTLNVANVFDSVELIEKNKETYLKKYFSN